MITALTLQWSATHLGRNTFSVLSRLLTPLFSFVQSTLELSHTILVLSISVVHLSLPLLLLPCHLLCPGTLWCPMIPHNLTQPTAAPLLKWHNSAITALSKFLPWSECRRSGTPYFRNHSFRITFAVASAFWSRVTKAWLNLDNTSVITSTHSRPSVARSRVV